MRAFLAFCTLCQLSCMAGRLQPVLKDVAYAEDNAAQCIDVYRSEGKALLPVMVFIHGGGWQAGSKRGVPHYLRKAVKDGWLAVVSVEYRFTDVAAHPAQVQDCVRAIQFVRHKAKEWNLDTSRMGVTGGSAGGHLSLWVALHDDAAKPEGEDPVERESSRVSCVISFAGPTDWSLLAELRHGHPGYRKLLGYAPGTPAADMKKELVDSVSPISYASADDPPTLLIHGDADKTVPIEHAQRMDARLRDAGVATELFVVKGAKHEVARGVEPGAVQRATAFIREQLGLPSATGAVHP